ncbi:MAG: hypothetical protein HQL22_03455 [Candidatus Omnitrophica bacterium]|nr:hypothetical protein [Candidatus Omnitrophota bacterium]
MVKDNKTQNNDLRKTLEIVGIGLSLNVVLICGPLIGYYLGKYLVGKGIISSSILFVPIVIGFAASLFNTVVLVRIMNRLSQNKERFIWQEEVR